MLKPCPSSCLSRNSLESLSKSSPEGGGHATRVVWRWFARDGRLRSAAPSGTSVLDSNSKVSKILVKIFPDPSIILPCAVALRGPTLLGACWAHVGRLLAEKVALQEPSKNDQILISFRSRSFRFLVNFPPHLGSQNPPKSFKNPSQDALHFGFHF